MEAVEAVEAFEAIEAVEAGMFGGWRPCTRAPMAGLLESLAQSQVRGDGGLSGGGQRLRKPDLEGAQVFAHPAPHRHGLQSQALHRLRLQCIGIEVSHQMMKTQQLPQGLDRGGAQHNRPLGGGLSHPFQQATMPVGPFWCAAIEHAADEHQTAFDSGVEALQPHSRHLSEQRVHQDKTQGVKTTHQRRELLLLHPSIQGQIQALPR